MSERSELTISTARSERSEESVMRSPTQDAGT